MDHEQVNQDNMPENISTHSRGQRIFKKIKKIFFVIVAVGIIVLVAFLASSQKFKRSSGGTSFARDAYYAVFLTNEQVYFGRITSKSAEETVLFDVFYLQTSGGNIAALDSEPRFNLVKLGAELHGPTDELRINTDHIIFYEEMRKDSKIVESINQYQR